MTDEEKRKPDFVLSDGTEINLNLKAVKRSDYQAFVNVRSSIQDENEFIAKITGLDIGYIADLDMQTFHELAQFILKACVNPFFGARV